MSTLHNSERVVFSCLYEKHVPGYHLHGSTLYFKDGYLHITKGELQSLKTSSICEYYAVKNLINYVIVDTYPQSIYTPFETF